MRTPASPQKKSTACNYSNFLRTHYSASKTEQILLMYSVALFQLRNEIIIPTKAY
jgi:hypothetical protein